MKTFFQRILWSQVALLLNSTIHLIFLNGTSTQTQKISEGSISQLILRPELHSYQNKGVTRKLQIHSYKKASGGDGISVELFQILKDDAVTVLHSICQHIWKTQQWPQDWKRSVFIPIPKKGNAKECSNYRTIALITHASKVMLKILQARIQQYVNNELPNVHWF